MGFLPYLYPSWSLCVNKYIVGLKQNSLPLLAVLRRQVEVEHFQSHRLLEQAVTFSSKTNLFMTVPRGKGRSGR